MHYVVDLNVPRTNIEKTSNPRSMIAQGDFPTLSTPDAPSQPRSKYMEVTISAEGSLESGTSMEQDMYATEELGAMYDSVRPY